MTSFDLGNSINHCIDSWWCDFQAP